jgi:hypothetical protein
MTLALDWEHEDSPGNPTPLQYQGERLQFHVDPSLFRLRTFHDFGSPVCDSLPVSHDATVSPPGSSR